MDYKLLECHVKFLHDQDEYTLFVAIESAVGYWKAYCKRCKRFDYAASQLTARAGTKIKQDLAEIIFPALKHLNYDD